MSDKRTYKTIDLWTEAKANQQECFDGAFIDGFTEDITPFDRYKVIRNCICKITSNIDLNISDRECAIIFYKNCVPIRLMVVNAETDVDSCISKALEQNLSGKTLKEIFEERGITETIVNGEVLPEYSIEKKPEMDIGSCDRVKLLKQMLRGRYTESESEIGNGLENIDYTYDPKVTIDYFLKTDEEIFIIKHLGAYISGEHMIPIQQKGPIITSEEIKLLPVDLIYSKMQELIRILNSILVGRLSNVKSQISENLIHGGN